MRKQAVTTCSPRPGRTAGFSLVEMMVALVAGLIVSGAVLAFAFASMKSNSDFMLSTRLTQELRNNMDLVTRDLRRAGYDEDSLNYLTTGTGSRFSRLLLGTEITPATTPKTYSCVIYSYDRIGGVTAGGLPEPGNGEIRGLRRAQDTVDGVGVMEYAVSTTGKTPTCTGASPLYTAYPVACNATSTWCALSDPKKLDIVSFTITDRRTNVPTATPVVQLRDLDVALVGRVAGSTDTRNIRSSIRVRTDCFDPALANCVLTP